MLDLAGVSAAQLIVASMVAGHDYVEGLKGYGIVSALTELQKVSGRHVSPLTLLQSVKNPKIFKRADVVKRHKCVEEAQNLIYRYEYPLPLRKPVVSGASYGPYISRLRQFANPAVRPGLARLVAGKEKNTVTHAEWRAGRVTARAEMADAMIAKSASRGHDEFSFASENPFAVLAGKSRVHRANQ